MLQEIQDLVDYARYPDIQDKASRIFERALEARRMAPT